MKNLIIKISLILFLVGNSFALEVESYLKENFSKYKYFTYEISSLPSHVDSIDDPRLKIDSDREFRVRKGYAYLPVKISHDENRTVRSTLTLKVKVYQDVLVSVRKIERGQEISSSDFLMVEKEIAGLNSDPIESYEIIDGAIAKTIISENTIASMNLFDRKPLIIRGDRIQASFIIGTVEVAFSVTAREDGCLGEKIRVVRDDKKIFTANVIDNKNVKIVE